MQIRSESMPVHVRDTRLNRVAKSIPLAAALLALMTGGCWSNAIASTPVKPPPTAVHPTLPNGTPVTLTIESAVAGAASLSPASSGLSFEKAQLSAGLFSGDNRSLIALFRQLGPGVLRIGGNSVNKTTWDDSKDPSGQGMIPGHIAPSDVDRLADFLNATGWRVIYGINFATENATQMSSEAAYVTRKLGSRLAGLELGNEPDLYNHNGLRPSTYTFNQFLDEWRTDARATQGSGRNPALTGPASSYNFMHYTIPFAQNIGGGIQLLTQHYYTNSSCPNSATGYAPSIPGMLAADPRLPGELQALVRAASDNGVSGGARMDEANSFYSCPHLSGAPGVSNAFASALWAVDFLFTNARYGMRGVNFHSGNTAYYSPIQTHAAAVTSVQPEYYGLWLFGQAVDMSSGTLLETRIDMSVQPPLPIKAYDVLAQDGSHRVLILNESASDGDVTVQHLPPNATRAALLRLSSTGGLSDIAAADVSVNGAHLSADGTWDSPPAPTTQPVSNGSMTVHVAAGSALLAIVR
ncbi:glycosyl hydrolase family 79 C-terminal domain-containing protein [Burkholderia cenocepacia]|uniref:glycosyl hydrolase family 79 C-terminal domain-containing protein n=1 Tax=Burkholderia cenocepacia TaxID=95486 RepID=UPI001177C635|nr:glycosyl hydrolase family 79 C-terminal domain-containing protein [Burkholderia cenocepacia]MBR8074732.1 hypothetical protein [Burkholderia cenocepacia]